MVDEDDKVSGECASPIKIRGMEKEMI
jgi:hypothetical protein